jgi:site-specific recombinase XerD
MLTSQAIEPRQPRESSPTPPFEEAEDTPTAATARWLATKADNTRAAYIRDLKGWLDFCDRIGIDPLTARKRHADTYLTTLTHLAPSTRERHWSALCSWYKYLADCELAAVRPFTASSRPKVDRSTSATRFLDEPEGLALLGVVDRAVTNGGPDALRNAAILRLMLTIGVRVTEVCTLTVASLGYQGGLRRIRLRVKGGKTLDRALPDDTGEAIDLYLFAERPDANGVEPLFATDSGRALDRAFVFKLVRRYARAAGIENPDEVTPHSLRHTFAVTTTRRGATLEQLQAAMGHVHPSTTRRYQHTANELETDPAHLSAQAWSRNR